MRRRHFIRLSWNKAELMDHELEVAIQQHATRDAFTEWHSTIVGMSAVRDEVLVLVEIEEDGE